MSSRTWVCTWAVLALVGVAAEARQEAQDRPGEALDPVVQDVVRMLEAGVASPLVEQWLEQSAARPGPLSANDLIALSRAEAPAELVRRLLALAAAPPSEEPSPPAAPARPPPAAEAEELAAVEFSIRYDSWTPELEEEGPWDLLVYLDGSPLAWTAGVGNLFSPRSFLVFDRSLAPGRHVLRLLQERHRLVSRRKGTWRHEARVFPQPLVLEVGPGAGWRLRLEVSQGRFRFSGQRQGPVSWALERGEERVAEEQRAGPQPEDWPLLCEEVEANLDPGQKVPRLVRRMLADCVRWSQLWPGVEGVPERGAVRQELARYDFRPVPVAARWR